MDSVTNKQEALLDSLIAECKSPEEIVGKEGLFRELQKRLTERVLSAESTEHLGHCRRGWHLPGPLWLGACNRGRLSVATTRKSQ